VRDEMLRRVAEMTAAGVQVIVLLALSDTGAPQYDHDNAAALATLGVLAFACTPDAFPDLMAAAIQRQDLHPIVDRLKST
jgi:VWA domain containing CoxE-like protein